MNLEEFKEQVREEASRENRQKLIDGVVELGCSIFIVFWRGLLVWLLWPVVVDLFGAPEMGYWQATLLAFLVRTLVNTKTVLDIKMASKIARSK